MSVVVVCPNLRCRATLQVPDSVRGKKVRCAKCSAAFVVPDKRPAEPERRGKPAEAANIE